MFVNSETLFLHAFKSIMYDGTRAHVAHVAMVNLNSLREGNQISMQSVRAATMFFRDIGKLNKGFDNDYEDHFVRPFLLCMEGYYSLKCQLHFQKSGGHYSFARWAFSRFKFEGDLATECIDSTLLSLTNRVPISARVSSILVRACIAPFALELLESSQAGVGVLLDDDPLGEALADFFKFVFLLDLLGVGPIDAACGGIDPTVKAAIQLREAIYSKLQRLICNHISEVLKKEVDQLTFLIGTIDSTGGDTSEVQFISSCCNHLRRFSNFFDNSAAGHPILRKALRDAFEQCLNVPLGSSTFAEVFSTHVDRLIRNQGKFTEEESGDHLDLLSKLFDFIREKDVFETCHKAKLGRRLLSAIGESTEHAFEVDRSFLSRIEVSMGQGFTYKMTVMINDMDAHAEIEKISAQVNEQQYLQKRRNQEVGAAAVRGVEPSFRCKLLTASKWPSWHRLAMKVHPALGDSMQLFEQLYRTNSIGQSKRLEWFHTLSLVHLTIYFPRGTKEVTCNGVQASILLAVDDVPNCNNEELGATLELSEEPLQQTITTLGLMIQATSEEGQPKCTKYMFNKDFSHKQRKFKLPTLLRSSTTLEQSSLEHRVNQRSSTVDAVIVRVLKARKILSFSELMDLCTKQLVRFFPVETRLIKQRLEHLIGREYARRHQSQNDTFEYVA